MRPVTDATEDPVLLQLKRASALRTTRLAADLAELDIAVAAARRAGWTDQQIADVLEADD